MSRSKDEDNRIHQTSAPNNLVSPYANVEISNPTRKTQRDPIVDNKVDLFTGYDLKIIGNCGKKVKLTARGSVTVEGGIGEEATIVGANIIVLGEVGPKTKLIPWDKRPNKFYESFTSENIKPTTFKNDYVSIEIDKSLNWIIRFDEKNQRFIIQHDDEHYELKHAEYSQITIKNNIINATSFTANPAQKVSRKTASVKQYISHKQVASDKMVVGENIEVSNPNRTKDELIVGDKAQLKATGDIIIRGNCGKEVKIITSTEYHEDASVTVDGETGDKCEIRATEINVNKLGKESVVYASRHLQIENVDSNVKATCRDNIEIKGNIAEVDHEKAKGTYHSKRPRIYAERGSAAVGGSIGPHVRIVAINIIALGKVSPDAKLKHSDQFTLCLPRKDTKPFKPIQFKNEHVSVEIDKESTHWIILFDEKYQKFIIQHDEERYELKYSEFSEITIENNEIHGISYSAKPSSKIDYKTTATNKVIDTKHDKVDSNKRASVEENITLEKEAQPESEVHRVEESPPSPKSPKKEAGKEKVSKTAKELSLIFKLYKYIINRTGWKKGWFPSYTFSFGENIPKTQEQKVVAAMKLLKLVSLQCELSVNEIGVYFNKHYPTVQSKAISRAVTIVGNERMDSIDNSSEKDIILDQDGIACLTEGKLSEIVNDKEFAEILPEKFTQQVTRKENKFQKKSESEKSDIKTKKTPPEKMTKPPESKPTKITETTLSPEEQTRRELITDLYKFIIKTSDAEPSKISKQYPKLFSGIEPSKKRQIIAAYKLIKTIQIEHGIDSSNWRNEEAEIDKKASNMPDLSLPIKSLRGEQGTDNIGFHGQDAYALTHNELGREIAPHTDLLPEKLSTAIESLPKAKPGESQGAYDTMHKEFKTAVETRQQAAEQTTQPSSPRGGGK